MTAIAKLLVFLALVLGVGSAVFATAVYTQRPPWFLDPPDNVPKGNVVLTFKGLAKDIDTAGKAATAASALYGKRRAELVAAERERAERAVEYAKLLKTAREADPGPAFFKLAEGTDGRIDLTGLTTPVKGPTGKALVGADTLADKIAAVTDRINNDLTPKIARHESDAKRLGAEIDVVAAKLVRQRTIREDLQNEASYLAAAGVNVAAQLTTGQARQRQLAERLKRFKPLD